MNVQGADETCDGENLREYKMESFATDSTNNDSFSSNTSEKSSKVADTYESIDIEGQQETGIWVHHPGSEVAQIWEPRKGKGRRLDTKIHGEGINSAGSFKLTASGSTKDNNIAEENAEAEKTQSPNSVKRGLHKVGSLFRRGQKNEKSDSFEEPIPSPPVNLRSVNSKKIGVKFIVDDPVPLPSSQKTPKSDGQESSEGSGSDSPHKGNVKDMAKNILRHAFSRKGSKKFNSESESQHAEKDASVESDSSEVDSPSSVVHIEPISVVSNPISGYGKSSSGPSENRILSPSHDAGKNILIPREKVILESKIGDNKSGHIERNESIRSGSPKLADGDMKVDN